MPEPHINLCLVLHNHQPTGNFDDVFEAAYQDSYLPFLDVFEPYEHLQISLHTSGPLATWLLDRHPEYVARVTSLVAQNRIEIVGGAFYEPILAMIPSRDRQGQIRSFTHWLQRNFGGEINGMWIPERVWESEFTSDLADAGISYIVLDDFHFRRAGLSQEQLTGCFVTENEGRILRVFPGSEQLRYLIPFQEPDQTIAACREQAERQPGSVIVFGDDGEKFGTWPDTKVHVYEKGWLKRFFDALTENRDWLKTVSLASAVANSQPQGKIFLPDASYREMTEWSLPVEKQSQYDQLVHDFEQDPRWDQISKFMAGGFWRNFKVKYPESNEMYARMMHVSAKLDRLRDSIPENVAQKVEDHLYQGQCNCSYWHGAFGGIYLPHLRNAVYQHLITADNLLEKSSRGESSWIDCDTEDYDFDGRNEIKLANDRLATWIAPSNGGMIYELDIREIGHNLLASMQRRSEVYHDKIRQGNQQSNDEAASIHDRVVFKQEGLDELLFVDQHLRKSLIDHCWDKDVSLQAIARGEAEERGDFVNAPFEATVRRNPDRIQVKLQRQGLVFGQSITINKGLTLDAGSSDLEIAYRIDGLPAGFEFHLGVEFNFAGMPAGQDDRFFRFSDGTVAGQLGETIDVSDASGVELVDQWLGLVAGLKFDSQCGLWAFPIHSVSQSESGFELVHQSVVVQPHWIVRGDNNGRWSTTMKLTTAIENTIQSSPTWPTAVASEA